MSTVVLENASFGYRRRPVVADVSCQIAPARCLGVFGANGAGKSTLLRGVTGLLRPMAGRVTVTPRTKFEYLPQQRATESHWPMTALDAASLATSARRWFGRVGRVRVRIREQLRELEVDDLARRPFFELSGGQQQRVLLAGALAAEPDVLLLDEPTSGLDERSRKLLLARLLRAKLAGLSLVVVSHDLEDLAALADTTICLQSGEDPSQPSYVVPEETRYAPRTPLDGAATVREWRRRQSH